MAQLFGTLGSQPPSGGANLKKMAAVQRKAQKLEGLLDDGDATANALRRMMNG